MMCRVASAAVLEDVRYPRNYWEEMLLFSTLLSPRFTLLHSLFQIATEITTGETLFLRSAGPPNHEAVERPRRSRRAETDVNVSSYMQPHISVRS